LTFFYAIEQQKIKKTTIFAAENNFRDVFKEKSKKLAC